MNFNKFIEDNHNDLLKDIDGNLTSMEQINQYLKLDRYIKSVPEEYKDFVNQVSELMIDATHRIIEVMECDIYHPMMLTGNKLVSVMKGHQNKTILVNISFDFEKDTDWYLRLKLQYFESNDKNKFNNCIEYIVYLKADENLSKDNKDYIRLMDVQKKNYDMLMN